MGFGTEIIGIADTCRVLPIAINIFIKSGKNKGGSKKYA
jgi:hypothetical protein